MKRETTMKKTVVVYKSFYGSSKKYAEWLSGEIGCDMLERKEVSCERLADYDTIVLIGGLYAGGMMGIDLVTRSFDMTEGKDIVLITCGIADVANRENVENIRKSLEKALKEKTDKVKIFHVRGGLDYSKMNFVHRTMMKALVLSLKAKAQDKLTDEDREIIATYGKKTDFTDKEYLRAPIEYIKSL